MIIKIDLGHEEFNRLTSWLFSEANSWKPYFPVIRGPWEYSRLFVLVQMLRAQQDGATYKVDLQVSDFVRSHLCRDDEEPHGLEVGMVSGRNSQSAQLISNEILGSLPSHLCRTDGISVDMIDPTPFLGSMFAAIRGIEPAK